MTDEKKGRRRILVSAVLFPLIAAAMLRLVFRHCDLRTVWRCAASADPRYLLPAAAAMCGFILCESLNIGRVIRASGYHVSLFQMLTYGASGFFFSGITPTASGGQPMQLVYMARDHIRLSHGSLSLLVELLGFQTANLSLALFGIFYNLPQLRGMRPAVQVLIAAGMGANAGVFAVLLLLIFRQRASAAVGCGLKRLCRALKRPGAADKLERQLQEYRAGSVYIRRHPGLLVKNIATSFLQLTAMYSITFFVYRALGGAAFGWARIFSMQAVLTAAIAVIPLPGSVGSGESGFRLMFSHIFSGRLLMPGMLLSRGISFYLGLLVTGVFLLVVFLCRRAGGHRQ